MKKGGNEMRSLTPHGVKHLMESQKNDNLSLILQMFKLKNFDANQRIRMRFNLSDGISFVLATIQKEAVKSQAELRRYKENDVVKITQFRKQLVQGRNIITLSYLPELVQSGLQMKIGDPRPFDENLKNNYFPNFYDCSFALDEDQALLQEQAKMLKDEELEEAKTPQRTKSYSSVMTAQQSSSGDRIKIERGKQQSVVKSVTQLSKLDFKELGGEFIPIKLLNTFMDEWVIKARVVTRQQLRPYDGKKRGVLFNVELIDEGGTKIQGSFFNQAAQKFDPIIKQGRVYKMGGGTLRIANKRYTSIQNDYCIYFNSYSLIQEIQEDQNIPEDVYDFCSIKEALKSVIGSVVDVIAVVQGVDSPVQLQTKKGDKLMKMMIYVTDDGEVPTNITYFGDQSQEIYETFTRLKPHTVVGFKECRVQEFRDMISLVLGRSSTIIIEPVYPRADKLHNWIAKKEKEGVEMPKAEAAAFSKAPLSTLSSIIALQEDILQGKNEGFVVRFNGMMGRILTNLQNMSYIACPTCQKKVVDGATQYYCEKCDENVPKPAQLYAFTFTIMDSTNKIIARVFRGQGEKIIGMKAEQVRVKVENDEYQEVNAKIKKMGTEEKNYMVRSKLSVYNGQSRVDYTVLRVGVKDVLQENKMLIERVNLFFTRLKIRPDKRK